MIDRLYTHALWMEGLYEAYPNGFTLWLWERAYRKLRKAHDESVKATTVKSALEPQRAFSLFFEGLTHSRAHKASKAALRHAEAYQNLIGYGSQRAR